ncbi:MAG: TonB-dependent receptor [Phenylobacterium sp.]|uniref:TonB-dependent receptor plug domain-containing protein n=1 Tax=Phenylobacterium sp. TaxID=1871053 RepID=UPI0012044A8F|nr:TonB-dependent receptor [Phenylobacterium sp.]TAJ74491.1 MAG: TonB-dependent receptor [Phenylobacterium sp.]
MRAWIMGGASVVALLAGAASAQEAADVQEVVVTGSRIARTDYVAESPIVTVGAAAVEARGPATLESTFNQMPQFAASNANSGSSPARQGRNNANLRGLGIQRTLVLLDGRRMQPSDALGAIDLNSITPALIENVEVITGGASAVYGSDAIAGVVNFKLRKNFSGLELDAQYGVTDRDDAGAVSISATMGGNFDEGRGNMVASLTYYDRNPTFRASRPFFERSGIASALQGGAIVSNASNLPTQAALNSVFSRYGSTASAARNASFGVNADGTIFTTAAPILNLRYPEGEPYITEEGRVGFPLGNTLPLQTPIERYTAFVRGSYDLTENMEAYLQFNYMTYDSAYSRPGWSAGSTAPLALIPVTNPFIPADLRPILASRPNPGAPVNFTFSTSRIGRTAYQFNYDLMEALVGLKGKVPGRDWTWDIYGSYGETDASETTSGWVNVQAWNSLVNAADGGASICPGGFNPFLAQALETTPGQEACFNHLNRTLHEETKFTQQIVEGSLQGSLFDLPAGRARFAVGASYRRATYDYAPPDARVRGEVWPVQATGPSDGSYNVKEGFAELYLPLLRDLPLVDELNFDVAYRFSDYNLVGSVHTYKASADWALAKGVRFRGGYQRAIRAPSLGELYAPPERASAALGSTVSGAGDPCDVGGRLRNPALNPNAARVRALCIAQGVSPSIIDIYRFAGSSVSGVASGNLDLKEETADTWTAGLVWQSRFEQPLLRRLSASLDFYDIKVKDAIGVITSSVGLTRCFNADGRSNPNYDPTNDFCQLTTRNTNGGIETQVQPTLNLAAYEVSGLDFQTDWGFDLEDVGLGYRGALSFNLVVSRLLHYKIQNLEGAPFLDYAGTIGNAQIDAGAIGFPDWKVAASATYAYGPATATLSYRWYDSMTHASDVGIANGTQPGVKDRQYVDLTGTWRLDKKTIFRAGVLNLFDVAPPVWTGAGATDLGLYDLLQRRYFVGVKRSF